MKRRVEDVRVEVDGRVAVARRTAGKAPTVVVLHGAGGNHRTYEKLLRALAPLGAIAPALPGRGGSEGAPLATAADAAAWTTRWLGAVGVDDRFVALGHSFGGAIAIELALASSARVAAGPALAALVLVSTGARLRVRPEILAAAAGGRDLGVWTGFDPSVTPTPSEVTLADWRAADRFDRMSDLGRITVPTLVIGGADDALTPPKYASYLAAQIPGARLRLFEGAGHDLVFTRAAEVAAEIRAFLAAALG